MRFFLINTHFSKILLLLYNHLQNLEIEIVEEFSSLKKEFICYSIVLNNYNFYIRELFENKIR